MKHAYYNSDGWRNYQNEVKLKARGNWDIIAEQLSADLALPLSRIGRHGPCPRHGGTDGFRLFKDFRETGGGICNSCGHQPDGFALLQWLNGWTFTQALRAVGDSLGVTDTTRKKGDKVTPRIQLPMVEYKVKSAEEVQREDNYKAKRLTDTWGASLAITDPVSMPARAYLRNRGITEANGPLEDLRVHPGLEYRDKDVVVGTFPTLLGLLRSIDGSAVTIQRQYLTPDGKKAPVENPRKIMPYRSSSKYNGSAVHLDHSVGAVLLATEGIETALAVRAMMGFPTWATCVAGLLENMDVPPSVRIVVVFGDKDRPTGKQADGQFQHPLGRGHSAASKLVARMKEQGRKATAYFPPFAIPDTSPKGIDWLDVLGAFGLAEARRAEFITGARAEIFRIAKELGLKQEDLHAHY